MSFVIVVVVVVVDAAFIHISHTYTLHITTGLSDILDYRVDV